MSRLVLVILISSLSLFPDCHGAESLQDLERILVEALFQVNIDVLNVMDLLTTDGAEEGSNTFAVIPRDDNSLNLAIIFPFKVANGSCGMKSKYYVDSRTNYVALPPRSLEDKLHVQCVALKRCDESFDNFWCIYDIEGQARAEMRFFIQKYINYTEKLDNQAFQGLFKGFEPDFKGLESLSLVKDTSSSEEGDLEEEDDDKVTKEQINLLLTQTNVNTIVISTFFATVLAILVYLKIRSWLKKRARAREELRENSPSRRPRAGDQFGIEERVSTRENVFPDHDADSTPRSRNSTGVIIQVPMVDQEASSDFSPDQISPSTYLRLQSPSMTSMSRQNPIYAEGDRIPENPETTSQDGFEDNRQENEKLVTNL